MRRLRFLVIGLASLVAGVGLAGIAVSRGDSPPSKPLPPGYTEIQKRYGDTVIRIRIPPRLLWTPMPMPNANPPDAKYAR